MEELTSVARALVAAVDTIESTAMRAPDVDLLAMAVPGCVRMSGMLAVLAGCLGGLAHALADTSPDSAVADIAVELDLMRALLHRATLAAAPCLAGLRRIPHH
jgi:hypothetical protein